MLQDTTTSQRLEYCFRVWRSWSGPAYDAPIVFYDPQIGILGTGYWQDQVALSEDQLGAALESRGSWLAEHGETTLELLRVEGREGCVPALRAA